MEGGPAWPCGPGHLLQGLWESGKRRRQRGGKGRARRTAIWEKSRMAFKSAISQRRAKQKPLSTELAVGNFQDCLSFAESNYLLAERQSGGACPRVTPRDGGPSERLRGHHRSRGCLGNKLSSFTGCRLAPTPESIWLPRGWAALRGPLW